MEETNGLRRSNQRKKERQKIQKPTSSQRKARKNSGTGNVGAFRNEPARLVFCSGAGNEERRTPADL